MPPPVRLAGIGMACSPANGVQGANTPANRLSAALSALPQGGTPVRLFHPIEEMAFLAAYEALSLGGVALPVGGEGIGMALGVDEGIDGIKARYYQQVLEDGPLGASPLTFPLTTPNTVAARLSILLDLRGESHTVCGGSLSGAQAIGLAMETLREGRCGAVLAGGATAVEEELLDALSRIGRPDGGRPRSAACLFLLEPQTLSETKEEIVELLGYGEGFGRHEIRDAVQACLRDSEYSPEQVGSVWVASGQDAQFLPEVLRRTGVTAPIVQATAADLYSASFPMAVAEAVAQVANGTAEPALIVGMDCLTGASAALVRCEGRR